MTDDDWARVRDRSILAAFQTGRSVFADSDGTLHYADGAKEPLADDIGMPKSPLPDATIVKLSWWARIRQRVGRRRAK